MMTTQRNQYWLPEVFNDLFDNEFLTKTNTTSPAINVVEKDNEYDVEYAAPGMTKKEESSTDDKENKSKKGVYLRREFSYSNFQQKMILPDDVDHEKISASVENGVLTVVLPKKNAEEQKKEVKMIDIK